MRATAGNQRYNSLKFIWVLMSVAGLSLGLACADLDGDTQFTQKLTANPFVAKLFGSVTRTVALNLDAGTHIAWMGLNQSGDYTFWSLDEVVMDGRKFEQEKSGSTVILENITASESAAIAQHWMNVTLTYSPLKPLEEEARPHQSYLLIALDKPKQGIIRIELNGFVRGVFAGKCNNVTGYEQFAYTFVNNEVQLYVCDAQAVTPDLANDPAGRPNTNFDTFPVEGNFTFYLHPSEDDVACVVGKSTTSDTLPSIPDFKLPVPPVPGLPEGFETISVSIVENSSSDCTVDAEQGSLTCDNNIELNVLNNQIPVTLSLSNTPIVPTAKDCANFPEPPVPAGKFGDAQMTVLAWGEIGFNNIIADFGIDGALVLAVIELEKVGDE